jgi:hypothetical protein
MSIVPLNLGAAAPPRLNPHLLQALTLSGFCVPQFGQNTLLDLRSDGAAYGAARGAAYFYPARWLKRSSESVRRPPPFALTPRAVGY